MLRTGLTIAAAAAALTFSTAFSPFQQASPSVIEIQLKNYEVVHSTLHLQRGVPIVLRLVDTSGTHSFSAPELFAASTLDPATAAMIRNGKVEVGEGGVELRLTPNAPGTYAFHCTHFMHSAFGMKGTAVVE